MASNKPVTTALTKVLADSYALYLKTQNYHWNVTGKHFRTLHLMFEEQYTELAAAIDVIAEQLRAQGAKAPGGFVAFAKLSSIKDGNENLDAMDMVRDLRDSHSLLIQSLKDLSRAAQKHEDDTSADLATERLRTHEKTVWMLSALLDEEATAK